MHAAAAHHPDREWGEVDGRDAEAARFEGQAVASGTRPDVEHPAAAQAERLGLDGRQLVGRAEQVAHGYFVFVELWRQHPQPAGLACGVEVADGLTHRIGLCAEQSVLCHLFRLYEANVAKTIVCQSPPLRFFIVLTQRFSASPEHKAIDVPGVMNGIPAVADDVV